jgi:hypothetical protein
MTSEILSDVSGLFSSARLHGVDEDGVRVRWPRRLRQIQGMTDGASVIGAMVDEVKKNLFTAQAAALAVDEMKVNGLGALLRGQ